MPNFIPYKYNKIVPSNLLSNIILMIGRAYDRIKRFDLGIRAMKYISSQIPQSELKILFVSKYSYFQNTFFWNSFLRNATKWFFYIMLNLKKIQNFWKYWIELIIFDANFYDTYR